MPSKRKIKRRQQTDEEVERNRKLIEQPNTELMIIKTIQGLMTCVNNELDKLGFNREQHKLVCKAKVEIGNLIEKVDLFEKTTLFELQKVFE